MKRKNFIVLTLGDADGWGYNEATLPLLLKLVDSSSPDYRMFLHTGVVANYLTSPQSLRAVEEVIAKAEKFRGTDSRFATLGIGLAEGELAAEFDWLGRLRTERWRPMGPALSEAVKSEREPQKYTEVLKMLRDRIYERPD